MDVPQETVELIAGYMDYATLKKFCMVSTTCRDAGSIEMQKLLELERKLERKRKLENWLMRRIIEERRTREARWDYLKHVGIRPSWSCAAHDLLR